MNSHPSSNRKSVQRSTHPTLPDINEANRNSDIEFLTPPSQYKQGQFYLPSPITPTLPDLHLGRTKDETYNALPNLLSPTLPSPFVFDLDYESKQNSDAIVSDFGSFTTKNIPTHSQAEQKLHEKGSSKESTYKNDTELEVTVPEEETSHTSEVPAGKTDYPIEKEKLVSRGSTESSIGDNLKNNSATDHPVSKRKAKVTLEDYRRIKIQNKESGSLGSSAISASSASPSMPLVQNQPDFELLKQNFIRLLADGKFQKKLADKKEKYSFLFAIDAVLCYVIAFHFQNVSNVTKNQPATTSNWRTLPAYIEFFLRSENVSLEPIFQGLFLGYLGIAFREIFNIELLRMHHLQHFLMKDIRHNNSEIISKNSTGNVRNLCENAVRLHDSYKRYLAAMKQCSHLFSDDSLKGLPITYKKFHESNLTNLSPPFCVQTSIADSVEFGIHLIFRARDLLGINSVCFGIFGRSVQMTQHRKLETNKQS
ncbi:hypothetical protein SPOG_04809 [Schizosaccharomyces cryophilus OY26]|uniref:Ell binding protein Ebp1 C-terminal domain-containing protein n=1 Tax=Schizosaccharomyces cryophilus (strain OY26 / ATCC MYA-4695 / CBS 11777 / NBRC 106824 / NRRL Y48691) TaxID=653667 RepID=S9X4Z3_SCHCR|nr:uncharacterized protein SPOG_04809 [Schizosaccharomyces cryophilus OY26]EPY52152.1 hypothetical protein SPOG_04809 [Schizosaccharomyces cryophilus OY26]